MPQLTITAVSGVGSVCFADPNPTGGLLKFEIEGGSSVSQDITWEQLQSLVTQLSNAETAGLITWSIAESSWDSRANEGSLSGLPTITGIDAAEGISFAGQDAITITGTNLEGNGVKASIVVGTGTNSKVTYEAISPGAGGNSYTIEHKTGTGEAVAVVGNSITVTLDTGVSTGTSIAALVNADATAKYMVKATAGGTGADAAEVVAAAALADGVGDGVSCTYGGEACVIVSVADAGTSIVINTADITADTEGTMQPLILTSDGKTCETFNIIAKSPALPTISKIDIDDVSTSGGAAGKTVTTTGIGSGQTKGTITLGTGANSKVTYEAVTPGAGGNAITVEHKTGAGEAMSVVGNVIEVTLDTGTSTGTSIAALVNADADAEKLVQATAEGTGADNAEVVAATALAGGIGKGVSCTFIGATAVITTCADDGTSLEIDIVTGGTNGDMGVLRIVSGVTELSLSLPIVA